LGRRVSPSSIVGLEESESANQAGLLVDDGGTDRDAFGELRDGVVVDS